MRKLRYFLETTPEHQPTRAMSLLSRHHAVWIEPNTSFGLAELDVFEMDLLQAEDTIHLFESAVDSTAAATQVNASGKVKLNKQKVKDAFGKHGINASDTIEQVALKIARNTKHKYLEP